MNRFTINAMERQYLGVLQKNKKGNKVTCMAGERVGCKMQKSVRCGRGWTGLDEMNFKDPTKQK